MYNKQHFFVTFYHNILKKAFFFQKNNYKKIVNLYIDRLSE